MKKLFILVFVAIVLVSTPFAAQATVQDINTMTVAELAIFFRTNTSKLTALLAELRITPNCQGTFARDLDRGSKDNARRHDVAAVQQILIDEGYLVIDSENPDSDVLGTYGKGTKAAMKLFQAANGISPTTGTFGPKTRRVMNERPCVVGTVDTLRPVVSSLTSNPVSPLTADKIGTDVVLTAVANDNVGVTEVEFFNGNTSLGTSSAPFTYTWEVPATGSRYNFSAVARDAAGNQSLAKTLRIDVGAPVDEPDETASTITVTSPNGGEQWEQGSEQNITWSLSGVDKVKLALVKGSNRWELASNIASTTLEYEWTVPAVLGTTDQSSVGTGYKIEITDQDDDTIKDQSNNFAIKAPVIESVEPSITSVVQNTDNPANYTVTGTNLRDQATDGVVKVDGVSATTISTTTTTIVFTVTPALTTGNHNVKVVTLAGDSNTLVLNIPAVTDSTDPSITSVTVDPANASRYIIAGSNLSGCKVYLDEVQKDKVSTTDTKIVFKPGTLTAGDHPVYVKNSKGVKSNSKMITVGTSARVNSTNMTASLSQLLLNLLNSR